MQAIVFERTGVPREVLEVREVGEPEIKPGEVLVEVTARPIHPSDLAFIRGAYRLRPATPQVAGLSGMGRVVKGEPDLGVPTGARVAFRWHGTWAERVAVPVERIFVLPDGVSDDDGAQLPLNPITAWGLLDVAHVNGGDWVGLTAPASSVSHLVASLAATRGVRTLPLGGADPDGLVERVRRATEGRGLSALLDSVGGSLVERLFAAMEPGGTLVAYGTFSDEPIAVRNATLIYANLTWCGFGIDRWLAGISREARAQMLDVLYAAIRDGLLPMPVRARFPLADVRRALEVASDTAPGKVFLVDRR